MPQKSIRQALNEALRQEMRRDPRIIVIGEDVAGGAATEGQRDAYGGMLGGKAKTPMVIRTMVGAGRSAAAQHSQSPYHIFTSVPGLKVVVPSNAYDAQGLLIQAIRDDDPVIFCEHKLMYDLRAEVPDEPYTIPFGEANIVRDGDDVTVVALARMVHYANEAAGVLEKEGIEV